MMEAGKGQEKKSEHVHKGTFVDLCVESYVWSGNEASKPIWGFESWALGCLCGSSVWLPCSCGFSFRPMGHTASLGAQDPRERQ